MSTMKNGFSTLNRWLGRKNKDKSVSGSNGKLSKSNNNLSLSISTIDINEASQLEYNRITPQPAATSNAPFEQTFRITVLLPKDQLYVTRLGARVPLSKLLELVCGNKLLSTDKYEFRNPVDASQVFDLNLSIGAVGLSEVRLCLKSDPYDSFNTDDVLKLRQSTGNGDSCSSSEFSSRQSKHTTKTISPYSSSNSLNSLESSSVHYAKVSAPSTPLAVSSPKISAPPRKKRVAPRPPSQTTIHEQTVLSNGYNEPTKIKSNEIILSKKDYYVSTPDLPVALTVPESSNNNNNNMSNKNSNPVVQTKDNFDANELYARVEKKNVRNLYGGSAQNLSSTQKETLPEASPRKHVVVPKKKSAPVPPSSNGNPFEMDDDISLSPSIGETSRLEQENNIEVPKVPKPASRETLENATQLVTVNNVTETADCAEVQDKNVPKPVPRVNTLTSNTTTNAQTNVSKVMLNRTPTPEPRSLCSDVGDMDNMSTSQLSETKQPSSCDEDDNASKQADSGIGEPIPSPVPDSLPSEGSSLAHEFKSTFESSSDDDEIIRVYNFKLGKTVTQPLDELKMLETTTTTSASTVKTEVEICSGVSTPATIVSENTPCPSETASWNFCIPISPPPNFADDKGNKELPNLEKIPDVPITPKIKERPVLDFASLSSETQIASDSSSQKAQKITHKVLEKQASNHSATTPLDEIVDELSAIIQQKGVGSLMKKPELPLEIESAKPNTLGNFSIVNISQQSMITPEVETIKVDKSPAEIIKVEKSPVSMPEEEKLYRKHSSANVRPIRKSITRADSFHTAADVVVQLTSSFNGGLNSRSSSYSTLTKLETNGNMDAGGKSSSSELSIAESPSLQSLEIIKTILNSRKNSLANSGSDAEDKTERQSEQIKPKTQEEESKPLPKVYRYSGPPSINLGTWNERPKASVSIKNEGDYIFGGKSATCQNAAVTKAMLKINVQPQSSLYQAHRASMPAFVAQQKAMENIRSSPPVVPVKPDSPIKRMGIPGDEVYRVPITVKPLKDATVDNHEVNASTLPRSKIHHQNGNAMNMALKRSSSITALEAAKVNKQVEEEKIQAEAPFGQSSLRKTGLKEKILSSTEQQKTTEESKREQKENADNQRNFIANLRKNETSTPRHFNRPVSKFQPLLHVNYQVKPYVAPKSAPAAPIPPPPPSFKPTTKHNSINNISACDPRDQLLDAIRNFKFDQLKSSNSQK